MAISQNSVAKLMILASVSVFIATLWFISNAPFKSQISLKTVTTEPNPVPNVSDSLPAPSPAQQEGQRADSYFLPAIAKTKDRVNSLKEKMKLSGLRGSVKTGVPAAVVSDASWMDDDKKRRPWVYSPRIEKVQRGKEKATLVMLAKNTELYQVRESMRRLEDRFNHRYNYPWTFMNDRPFTKEFMEVTKNIASGPTEYVLIPKEHWGFPEWVNQTLAREKMYEMGQAGILYGGSVSYRRVEPGVHYFCDQFYDPFTWLRENNKTYGFTMVMSDYLTTIPTLWEHADAFFTENPTLVHLNNMHPFILGEKERDGKRYKDYNTCHFWTNFEIANLDLWRNDRYIKYFEHLDKSGGFFYERWGDAPVHSIALATMVDKAQIHFFNDIGYDHNPYRRCPKPEREGMPGRCLCPQGGEEVDDAGFACFKQWKATYGDDYEIDLTW
ncbi:hypothetical protein TWF694_001217 [Orbilia ellipsospora]|uniref:Glycosyltransferase family 15 protein n=1 Tax=Orbilia ellipsospora TaxID=2528407 RepID=A0AAV9XSK4_9PEZI